MAARRFFGGQSCNFDAMQMGQNAPLASWALRVMASARHARHGVWHIPRWANCTCTNAGISAGTLLGGETAGLATSTAASWSPSLDMSARVSATHATSNLGSYFRIESSFLRWGGFQPAACASCTNPASVAVSMVPRCTVVRGLQSLPLCPPWFKGRIAQCGAMATCECQ